MLCPQGASRNRLISRALEFMFPLIYFWRGLHRVGQLISCPKEYGPQMCWWQLRNPATLLCFRWYLLVSEFTTLPGAGHWTILLSALSGGKRGELLLPIVRFCILAARMGMKRVFFFSVDLVETRVSFVFIN